MIEREFFPRFPPTRIPSKRYRLAAPFPTSRRSSGLPVFLIGILALLGWLTPSSTQAQASWTSLGLDHPILTLAIDPSNHATLYAGTDGEGAFKSTDSGASWTAINSGLPDLTVNVLAIDPMTPSTLYGSVYGDGVFKSTDGGGHWADINSGLTYLQLSALAIDPTTPSTLYAGSFGSGVFKSTDGGGHWATINNGLTGLDVNALAINPATPATLYAGTLTGAFKSTNGGRRRRTGDACHRDGTEFGHLQLLLPDLPGPR